MTDDVMTQLFAVQPLPRGERLARRYDRRRADILFPGNGRPSRWWNLGLGGVVMREILERACYLHARDAVAFIRAYAAPLRKAREELRKLRDEIMFVEDVALKFQGENEELLLENARLRKQFMQVKKDSP